VPELCRFFGIIIRIYREAGERHHTPHSHAYYQDDAAIFSIDPIEMARGATNAAAPPRPAWAELHQQELLIDWERLQSGQPTLPIEPLK
jgi:hypothetical protein